MPPAKPPPPARPAKPARAPAAPKITACAPLPAVEVRDSAVHGLGVFALKAMPKGSTVGHYDGRRYTARQIAKVAWNEKLTYLFGMSDGSTIDGGEGGNATRHLNHACAPNCAAQEEDAAGGLLAVRIVTTRRVRAGDELSAAAVPPGGTEAPVETSRGARRGYRVPKEPFILDPLL